MPKIDLFDIKGKTVGQVDLPKEIFGTKVNLGLIAQAVRVFLANQRQATAKAKGRGEVKGSGRKIYRQKGTGHARHGDKYAPIFVGGGSAHGPSGFQNFSLKMSKTMKQKALFSALTSLLQEKRVYVVKLDKFEPKTKNIFSLLKDLKIDGGKLLLVVPEMKSEIVKAARNIKKLKILPVGNLNTYEVINNGNLVFLLESIDKLKQLAKQK